MTMCPAATFPMSTIRIAKLMAYFCLLLVAGAETGCATTRPAPRIVNEAMIREAGDIDAVTALLDQYGYAVGKTHLFSPYDYDYDPTLQAGKYYDKRGLIWSFHSVQIDFDDDGRVSGYRKETQYTGP